MGGTRRRLARFVAGSTVAGLATLMLGAVPAHAVGETTITYNDVTGAVTITAASGIDNDVTLSGDGTVLSASDTAGWTTSSTQCLIDTTDVVCTPDMGDAAIGAVTVNLGDGNDTFLNDQATETGTSFTFNGGTGDDTLDGNDSNETISGNYGADTVRGAGGDDTLNGDTNSPSATALYNDTVRGGDGDDTINGQNGVDRLFGDDDDDTINGGGSNDTLDGGLGDDVLTGGTATDTATYADRIARVVVTIGAGANDGQVSIDEADDVQSDVENVTTGTANDTVTGSSGPNTIRGGLGDDTINGGAGIDALYGQAGEDSLTGGTGSDRLYGGADDDSLFGNGDSTKDFLYCAAGEDGYRKDAGSIDVLDKCEVNLAA